MDIDGLARHAILLGEACNAFSESETRVDGLYLFLRQRRLPAAPIVGITLSGEEDALTLSLFYHLAFKLGYRAENVEIQGLTRIGVTAVKLHPFLVEDDFYAPGKQLLHEVEQVAERTCQAIYAVDVERVAVTEIGETLRQGRTIGILAGTFVLVHLVQRDAVKLSLGVLIYGRNSDVANLLAAHSLSLCLGFTCQEKV